MLENLLADNRSFALCFSRILASIQYNELDGVV